MKQVNWGFRIWPSDKEAMKQIRTRDRSMTFHRQFDLFAESFFEQARKTGKISFEPVDKTYLPEDLEALHIVSVSEEVEGKVLDLVERGFSRLQVGFLIVRHGVKAYLEGKVEVAYE